MRTVRFEMYGRNGAMVDVIEEVASPDRAKMIIEALMQRDDVNKVRMIEAPDPPYINRYAN